MGILSLLLVVVLCLVVSFVLCVAAFFLFSGLRGLYAAAQRVLKLRSVDKGDRSIGDVGCRG